MKMLLIFLSLGISMSLYTMNVNDRTLLANPIAQMKKKIFLDVSYQLPQEMEQFNDIFYRKLKDSPIAAYEYLAHYVKVSDCSFLDTQLKARPIEAIKSLYEKDILRMIFVRAECPALRLYNMLQHNTYLSDRIKKNIRIGIYQALLYGVNLDHTLALKIWKEYLTILDWEFFTIKLELIAYPFDQLLAACKIAFDSAYSLEQRKQSIQFLSNDLTLKPLASLLVEAWYSHKSCTMKKLNRDDVALYILFKDISALDQFLELGNP